MFAFRMLFNMLFDFSLSLRLFEVAPRTILPRRVPPELFLPFAIKVNGYREIRLPLFIHVTPTKAARKKDKTTRLRVKRSREGGRVVTRLHKHFISPVNVRLAKFARRKCFLITARGKEKIENFVRAELVSVLRWRRSRLASTDVELCTSRELSPKFIRF